MVGEVEAAVEHHGRCHERGRVRFRLLIVNKKTMNEYCSDLQVKEKLKDVD